MSTQRVIKTGGTQASSRVDQTFRVFADRARRRIPHLLLDGEFCVSDIIGMLQVPRAKASRHLNCRFGSAPARIAGSRPGLTGEQKRGARR